MGVRDGNQKVNEITAQMEQATGDVLRTADALRRIETKKLASRLSCVQSTKMKKMDMLL